MGKRIDDIMFKVNENIQKHSEAHPDMHKYLIGGAIGLTLLAIIDLLGGAGYTNHVIQKEEKAAGIASAYNLAKRIGQEFEKSIVFYGSRVAAENYIAQYDKSKK